MVTSPADEHLVSGFSGRLDGLVGRFLGRPRSDQWVWDQQLFTILGYTGPDVAASLQTLLQHIPAEERQLTADAFEAAAEPGDPLVVSCRLHAADHTVRSVLITAEVTDNEPSELSMSALRLDGLRAATGPWLVGHLIDLTALRLGATRAAASHAVTEATKHRAVIEQAKGILMLTYQIDADTAFNLLRRHSQNTNTKVHDLAAHLVDQVTMLNPATAAAEVDALLQLPPRIVEQQHLQATQ